MSGRDNTQAARILVGLLVGFGALEPPTTQNKSVEIRVRKDATFDEGKLGGLNAHQLCPPARRFENLRAGSV